MQLPQNERTTATYAERAQTPQVPTLQTKKKRPEGLYFYGATLLMSLGNIEHSFTFAMPRKQAVMRSRPMAKPP